MLANIFFPILPTFTLTVTAMIPLDLWARSAQGPQKKLNPEIQQASSHAKQVDLELTDSFLFFLLG